MHVRHYVWFPAPDLCCLSRAFYFGSELGAGRQRAAWSVLTASLIFLVFSNERQFFVSARITKRRLLLEGLDQALGKVKEAGESLTVEGVDSENSEDSDILCGRDALLLQDSCRD